MSSDGNTPSRGRNEDAAFVQLPNDSGQDYTTGGRPSLDPLPDPRERAEFWAQRTDLRFPLADRYQQLSDPIPGGMGVVFKALDKRLGINVAIKRIRPELARNTELIQRFEREAKLQVRLKHQNLVSVKDYDSDSYGPYIVMDWIDGQSLASVIRNSGPMPWRDAAILISKVAMALQEAHENKIIHRDVKPGNILLDKKGEPYITDFGLACAESASVVGYVSDKEAAVGTAYFMSPEQRQNPKDVTYLTDMWSLGATLYQLLTTEDVMAWDPDLIPAELRSAVTTALKRSPSDRFGTMKLLAQELTLCVSNNGPKPATAKAASPPAEDDIADIWRKAQERTDMLQAEAKSIAERKQDYAAAVRIMEQIPEHVRKKNLYDELIRRRDRVVALEARIGEGVGQMRTEGIRDAINELLKLQPNRPEMKKLLEQLPPELPPKTEVPVTPPQRMQSPAPTPTPTQSAPKKPSRPSLLVAPFDQRQAKMAQQEWAKYLGINVDVSNSLGMKFRVIPPGTFDMGSPTTEWTRSSGETLHKVTISQPTLLGVYPVTQAEWIKMMGSNPSYNKPDSGQDTSCFPVEQVSWEDSQQFLERLNQSHSMKGWRYRLPMEAEWEYACRAGTVTPFWFGGELNGNQANCDGTHPYQTNKGPYLKRTCVVGSYGANPFGLYDQHGNVWEWCQDWYAAYDTSVNQDPTGPSSGSCRILRGGSWIYFGAFGCRSASRHYFKPSLGNGDFGFRVVSELS